MYKKQFNLFNRQDNEHFPDDDINLFVGSSSIRRWETLEEDMKPKKALNRGFGGSTMAQLLMFNECLILKYKFKKIFIYEGDNGVGKNINKIHKVLDDFKKIVEITHNHQPEAQINFISIKCSVYRKPNCHYFKIANEMFKDYCQTEDYLNYIDIYSGFLNEDGSVKAEFINADDGVHPSSLGYKYMTQIIKPFLFPEG